MIPSLLTRIQRRILVSGSSIDLVALAGIGILPTTYAIILDFADGLRIATPSLLEQVAKGEISAVTRADGVYTRGYLDVGNLNWSLYPFLLPLALFLTRKFGRRLFWISENISKQDQPQLRPFQAQLHAVLQTPKPIVLAIILTLLAMTVDMWPDPWRFLSSTFGSIDEADWTRYDIIEPSKYSHLTQFGMTTLAYISQATIGFLAFLLLATCLYYNRAFLGAIYTQSRRPTNNHPQYVIDWRHPDRRFGLAGFNSVFNTQLAFVAVVGAFILVSRYANTTIDAQAFVRWIADGIALVFQGDLRIPHPPAGASQLLRDVGQWILALGWMSLVAVAMLPAKIKLLPMQNSAATESAAQYLPEFLPANDPRCEKLRSADVATVTEEARHFAMNDFWPSGDARAQKRLWIAAAVLVIIILPIAPAPTWHFVLCGIVITVLSYLMSRVVMWRHRSKLHDVDPRLVEREP